MTITRIQIDSIETLALLTQLRKNFTQNEIATALSVSERQVRRWEVQEEMPPLYKTALQRMLQFDVPAKKSDFQFIDLFAGIGGIRIAFESIGGECVFTSEWDTYAQKTYLTNFPAGHRIAGDITKIHEDDVPNHDVLLAGFPCQPFSIAGVSKKNSLGRAHGFADVTQGTLFFDVARIIARKRPAAFMLENVKNLKSHDKGRTFDVIYQTLTKELGYKVFVKIIDSAHFVPQHRERILIVGFRDDAAFDWEKLNLPEKGSHLLKDILHKPKTEDYIAWDAENYYSSEKGAVLPKYTLTDNLWLYLQNYKKKHQEKGNGFGFGLVTKESVTRTLSARYYKDGSEILLSQGSKKNPRRLTPRECARLMGFSDDFKIPVSDTRAYKQFGNSVVVPVMTEVAKLMRPFILDAVQIQPEPMRLAA